MIYSFYLFDKHCNCVFIKTWPQNINNGSGFGGGKSGNHASSGSNGGTLQNHQHKGSESRAAAISSSLTARFSTASKSSSLIPPVSPLSGSNSMPSSASVATGSTQQFVNGSGGGAVGESGWSFRNESSGHQKQSSLANSTGALNQSPDEQNLSNTHASSNDKEVNNTNENDAITEGRDLQEQAKLIYGVIYSLRNFVQKLSPTAYNNSGNNNSGNSSASMHARYASQSGGHGGSGSGATKLSSTSTSTSSSLTTPCSSGFMSFRTSKYKLHHYLTASGITLVLMTDPRCETMIDVLHGIYGNVYVKTLVKQPGVTREMLSDPGFIKSNQLFNETLEKYIKSLVGGSGGSNSVIGNYNNNNNSSNNNITISTSQ